MRLNNKRTQLKNKLCQKVQLIFCPLVIHIYFFDAHDILVHVAEVLRYAENAKINF